MCGRQRPGMSAPRRTCRKQRGGLLCSIRERERGRGSLDMHVVGFGTQQAGAGTFPCRRAPRAWVTHTPAARRRRAAAGACLPPAAAAHQGLTKTAAPVGTPRQWLARAPWRPLRVVGRVEPQTEPPQLVPRNTHLLFPLLRRMTFRFPAQPSLSALDAKVAT